MPEILDTSTARVLDKAHAARRAGDGRCRGVASRDSALSEPYADIAALPERAVRCQNGHAGSATLLARAADVPDFAMLEAFVAETQAKVRGSFVRILGKAS